MSVTLQPLTLGELLDRTFTLYRRHFAVFAGIVALPQLVILALQLAQPGAPPTNDPAVALAQLGHRLLWFLLMLGIGIVLGAAAQGATVVAVSESYLERPTGIGSAYGAIWRRLGLLCGLGLAYALAVTFGALLFLIPGILIGAAWALLVPVAIIEHTGFGETFGRTAFLTRGYRWRIFAAFVFYIVLVMVVSGLWQFPLFIAAFSAARAGTPGQVPGWVAVLGPVGSFVTQCLVGPLLTIMMALIYYDLRVRKEGFDLEHMMAQLDRQPVGVSPAGA
jgi:hypothetical protein